MFKGGRCAPLLYAECSDPDSEGRRRMSSRNIFMTGGDCVKVCGTDPKWGMLGKGGARMEEEEVDLRAKLEEVEVRGAMLTLGKASQLYSSYSTILPC